MQLRMKVAAPSLTRLRHLPTSSWSASPHRLSLMPSFSFRSVSRHSIPKSNTIVRNHHSPHGFTHSLPRLPVHPLLPTKTALIARSSAGVSLAYVLRNSGERCPPSARRRLDVMGACLDRRLGMVYGCSRRYYFPPTEASTEKGTVWVRRNLSARAFLGLHTTHPCGGDSVTLAFNTPTFTASARPGGRTFPSSTSPES